MYYSHKTLFTFVRNVPTFVSSMPTFVLGVSLLQGCPLPPLPPLTPPERMKYESRLAGVARNKSQCNYQLTTTPSTAARPLLTSDSVGCTFLDCTRSVQPTAAGSKYEACGGEEMMFLSRLLPSQQLLLFLQYLAGAADWSVRIDQGGQKVARGAACEGKTARNPMPPPQQQQLQ
jgi:hypothetical protein